MIKYYRVRMIHDHIRSSNIHIPLPDGYYFRNFKDGDQEIWAQIETAAGEFSSIDKALKRFTHEFAGFEAELESRCFFLCDSSNDRVIGTSMGWYGNEVSDEIIGRLHWVAIHPDYQGRKLGKPLVARAIERIQQSHTKAYLTSQTTSWKAINMYLDFGFRPLYMSDDCSKAWELLSEKLNRHIGS